MADPIVYDGKPGYPGGKTPFGYYDKDTSFINAAPKVADYIARRLGYPVLDVELVDSQMYAAFEEAITEYGAQVNQFNVRENMLTLRGSPTTGSITGHNIIGTPLPQLVKMASSYGTEAGVGGNVDIKKGYVTMYPSTQSYDLQEWAETYESGSRLEIRRVFHDKSPAISRYFDPLATSGLGIQGMMDEMGFSQMSVGTQFVMMPVYEDLLRVQAIEFNDLVRKSSYSFELVNNKIRIFPIPQMEDKLWFDYYVVKDKAGSIISETTDSVSDVSNAPFKNITYSKINDIGRMWITKYSVALAKEMLGGIRGKYSTIPIPNAEVTLDGATLRQEAHEEKEKLIQELRETLNESGNTAQMKKEMENAENMQKMFSKIPNTIYIG